MSCDYLVASRIEGIIIIVMYITDCNNLPSIDNATTAERFGPHKTLNTGLKYKCTRENVKMVGNPYAICRQSDEWEVRFECKTIKGVFKHAANLWINFCMYFV